jgi:hypothetical protein
MHTNTHQFYHTECLILWCRTASAVHFLGTYLVRPVTYPHSGLHRGSKLLPQKRLKMELLSHSRSKVHIGIARASLAGWDQSFLLQDRRRVRSTERAVVVCDTQMCRSNSEDQLWSERRPLRPENETFIHSSFVLQHYRYVPSYQSHKRQIAKCRGNTGPSAGTCPTSDLQVPCPTPSYISPASSHQLTIAIHPLLISSGDSQRIGGRLNANQ